MNQLLKDIAKQSKLVHRYGKATNMQTGEVSLDVYFNLSPRKEHLEELSRLIIQHCKDAIYQVCQQNQIDSTQFFNEIDKKWQ